MWDIAYRGFLPKDNPIHQLEFEPEFQDIEYLVAQMPLLTHQGKFRDEAVSCLKLIDPDFYEENDFDLETVEKLFKHYCYIASAYVHALNEPKVESLPAVIAVPLVHLSELVGRPPILSYASYCLNNWRLNDPAGLIHLDNLSLQQNFSHTNKQDEDWFILVHVEIEYCASLAMTMLNRFLTLDKPTEQQLDETLRAVLGSLIAMNKAMSRMPEKCGEDFYFKAVRPFIFGFENIVYEDCFNNEPQSYRGETGAQSSIVPSFVAALGIEHKDSMLTKHLDLMRSYMPIPHRMFIEKLENKRDEGFSLRGAVIFAGKHLDLYNQCLEELLKFRTKHLEYAVNYIQKKVDNPTGTGGTPFIPWLSQLRDETDQYFLK